MSAVGVNWLDGSCLPCPFNQPSAITRNGLLCKLMQKHSSRWLFNPGACLAACERAEREIERGVSTLVFLRPSEKRLGIRVARAPPKEETAQSRRRAAYEQSVSRINHSGRCTFRNRDTPPAAHCVWMAPNPLTQLHRID
jgi:hypothetical protein